MQNSLLLAKGDMDIEETQPADIEDIVSNVLPGRKRLTVSERSFVRQKTPEETVEDVPLPDPLRSYSAWIQAMRPRWKRLNESRIAGSNVPSMFKSTRVRTDNRWDILQLRESKTPGRFILWLSTDSEILS